MLEEEADYLNEGLCSTGSVKACDEIDHFAKYN